MTHPCSAEVTHAENRIGNTNRDEAGDIIHAEGVGRLEECRERLPVGVLSDGWRECGELGAEVADVVGREGSSEEFLDDRHEVGEGAHRSKRGSIVGAQDAARGGEQECRLDDRERDSAPVEVGGDETIVRSDAPEGPGGAPIAVEHAVDVGV
jgi:hypothetical protein